MERLAEKNNKLLSNTHLLQIHFFQVKYNQKTQNII